MPCTDFHFFYALAPRPPYRVTNVSHPFRFASLGRASLEATRHALGGSFSRRSTSFVQEKIQFASGLVVVQRRGARVAVAVSWGVADCTGASRELEVATVGALLSRRTRLQTV